MLLPCLRHQIQQQNAVSALLGLKQIKSPVLQNALVTSGRNAQEETPGPIVVVFGPGLHEAEDDYKKV
ncbi:hypothetical protein G4Y79_00595 [Phototrophicus methaneseepsis]|uniref:Uncharacterized protein n=1 Tax=Phototrophicus methaneseepsis TaxID=2710758 RepID=A0A7S8IFF6_9CHLR|nr:hypothetical protein [Phototrophicus methaneseepsis]QPC82903.1 hypothetical protein G4Y79_00595 [Phototrophicus methaneseepsis]